MTTEKEYPALLLTDLPMPPSSNHQYVAFRRGNKIGHAASKGLKLFKREMQIYHYAHRPQITGYRNEIQEWLKNRYFIKVSAVFIFPYSDLFTQKGLPKKMDVSNRLKALHDCLADFFEVDDSLFFQVEAEKRRGDQLGVSILMSPCV